MNAWPGPTHPTGPAGPTPTGPAGPAPTPTGPTVPSPFLRNFADVVPGVEAALIEQLAVLTQDLEVLPRRGGWQDLVVAAEVHGVVVELVEMALVELARIKTPAHRDLVSPETSVVATTGGPVQTPSLVGPGERERPTPGLAAAIRCAARESAGAVVAPGAGADVCAGGPPSPGVSADFRLPRDIRGGTDGPARALGPKPPLPPPPPNPPPPPSCATGVLYDALPVGRWVDLPRYGVRVKRWPEP